MMYLRWLNSSEYEKTELITAPKTDLSNKMVVLVEWLESELSTVNC